MSIVITPFEIAIPDADLESLRSRLMRTRWPRELGDNADWRDGVSLGFMRELVDYWLDGYDWRGVERAMNTLPQFKTEIDGVPIHFVHVRGKGPDSMPVVLNHGWPSTFWDLRSLIGPLTDPAAYGGDPALAFDVVLPSLPGFAFSSPLSQGSMTSAVTADLWAKLMSGLGYDRFAAQGEELGALVAAELGRRHGDRTIGVHLQAPLSAQTPYLVTADALGPYGKGEEGWEARTLTFLRERSAYLYVQRTRPQSIAMGLHNSPVGLAAWLADCRHALSGQPVPMTDRDDLITNVMLYWLTETFVSAAGHFYNARPDQLAPDAADALSIGAPAAVLQFLDAPLLCPKAWAERVFDLRRWTLLRSDGSRLRRESSTEVAKDMHSFFRSTSG